MNLLYTFKTSGFAYAYANLLQHPLAPPVQGKNHIYTGSTGHQHTHTYKYIEIRGRGKKVWTVFLYRHSCN